MPRRPGDKELDKCPVHDRVLKECVLELSAHQVFSKEDILKRLGFTGIAQAVYWDYIRRKIENGGMMAAGGAVMQLLPVSPTFFKVKLRKHKTLNSLLAGPGGKSAGFALATIDGGTIALAAAEVWHHRGVGMVEAARKRAGLMADQLDDAFSIEKADEMRNVVGLPKKLA